MNLFVSLGNRQALRLLEVFLKNPTTEFSTGSAIHNSKLAKATALRWLAFLEKNQILLCKTIGRTKLYRLACETYFVRQLRKFYNSVSPVVRELAEALEGRASKIMLFGSYARGENRTESDIDILVVSERSEAELKRIAAQLSSKHKKKLALAVKTSEQYLQMAKAEELLWRKISMECVLLYGD